MRAFLGVSDKTGIAAFAQGLHSLGWDLMATSGTRQVLQEAGIPSRHFSELTGHGDLLGGRLKTLHPAIHAGLLYRRGFARDEMELEQHGWTSIDLVAASFYPFEKTATNPAASLMSVLDSIDIGGPAMIRAAAKNYMSVIPVVDIGDYALVLAALRGARGAADGLDVATRRRLAAKVFEYTSRYDAAIAAHFKDVEL